MIRKLKYDCIIDTTNIDENELCSETYKIRKTCWRNVMIKYIDLSRLIEDKLKAYPGDNDTSLKKSKYLQRDSYNNYLLTTGMHTGTHIDSPMHLTENPKYIYEYPVGSFIGKGVLINIDRLNKSDKKRETYNKIDDNSIVLLYTNKSSLFGTEEYFDYTPDISDEFLSVLIQKNIKMLGMDCSSPDKFPFPVHKKLFANSIFIIENLTNLDTLVGVNKFEIIALPLNIVADSSIARVIAKIET